MNKLYFSTDLKDYKLTGKGMTSRGEKSPNVRNMAILQDWKKVSVAKIQGHSGDGCEAK